MLIKIIKNFLKGVLAGTVAIIAIILLVGISFILVNLFIPNASPFIQFGAYLATILILLCGILATIESYK